MIRLDHARRCPRNPSGSAFHLKIEKLSEREGATSMRDLCSARPFRLQLLRTILLLLNSASTFAGLLYWPLPVTTSLAMLAPLITTLLAATPRDEHVSPGKWAMVVLGFASMLMAVRPGSGEFSWTVLFAIGAATTFACFQEVSSRLSRTVTQ